MKDLIIGAYSNYNWDQIKYWVNSIDKCGFTGKKVIIMFTIDPVTVQNLLDKGFEVIQAPLTPGLPVHVDRFAHIWNYLDITKEKYRYVITTDVRDVVFQTNPSDWFVRNMHHGYNMVAASELLQYQYEPWGNNNLYECFGPFFHQKYKDREIYNVGTIGGFYETVKDLALMIFQMSLNRPIPIVDQAVYNFLLYQEQYKLNTIFDRNTWAATLGTTLDPSKSKSFEPHWLDNIPWYTDDGIVRYAGPINHERISCIVHQYDRVPGLKELIEKKYSE